MTHIVPIIILIMIGVSASFAMDNLTVAFRWKKLDFHFRTEDDRQTARSKWYIDFNNVPVGIEVYRDKLFITIPRLREGVAASLAYIKLTDSIESPKLYPYPNWEAHRPPMGRPREIDSPLRIRADRCGRLWVLDSGISNLFEETMEISKPRLLIYNLTDDRLIRTYGIPENQTHPQDSLFANIAVEDNNCKDSFAYLADLGHPGMVVYSFESNTSWLVKHHYFSLDPLASNLTVNGKNFHPFEGLLGMALQKQPDGYSTLYFHPVISYNEFTVSTKVLRNETLATNPSENFHEFKLLGTRCTKGQSGTSFYHDKSKVLFYTLLNLDAVACWRSTNPKYDIQSQGRVYVSNRTMVFPSSIKVDENDTLWVLSNQLPVFMMDPQKWEADYMEYHFRILKSPVGDAIKNTSCDSKIVIPKSSNGEQLKSWSVLVTVLISATFWK